MPKKLILAEKPSQARDIAAGLSETFTQKEGYSESANFLVTYAIGHLVELEPPDAYDERYARWRMEDLPIIPEKFRYTVTDSGKKQFNVIKGLLRRPDINQVVICTDPGREGELIARLILQQAGSNIRDVKRFWTSKALTPDAVKEGFATLKNAKDFDSLYYSAQARQWSDWLIGMNCTRGFTVMLGDKYTLGRVQTPTLGIIVARENEIANFKPQTYFMLKAFFEHKQGDYCGLWFSPAAETNAPQEKQLEDLALDVSSRISTEEQAKEIQARVTGKKGAVQSRKSTSKSEPPPLLFNLTVLQQEANRLYGFSADKTLAVAQSLYETKKAITYPRTESQYLNEEMAVEAPRVIKGLQNYPSVVFDPAKVNVGAKNKRVYNTSKLTDHHALIPTGKIPGNLPPDEAKVYELIVRRFIAAFYPAHKYNSTLMVTVVGQDSFKTRGKTITEQGWKEVYGEEAKDTVLPVVKAKDPVEVKDAEFERKQTTPPPRYTEATLLAAMTNAHRFVEEGELKKALKEAAGLGTPATRASIIETLKARNYIVAKSRYLAPTPKGMHLISLVKDERISSPAETAMWEQELEAIWKDGADAEAFMAKIKDYTVEAVKKAGAIKGKHILPQGQTQQHPPLNHSAGQSAAGVLGRCPDCGKDIRDGQKSYYCVGYKEGCRFAIYKNALERLGHRGITPRQAADLLQGKTIKLSGLTSKAGRKFDAGGRLAKSDEYNRWQIQLVFGK